MFQENVVAYQLINEAKKKNNRKSDEYHDERHPFRDAFYRN